MLEYKVQLCSTMVANAVNVNAVITIECKFQPPALQKDHSDIFTVRFWYFFVLARCNICYTMFRFENNKTYSKPPVSQTFFFCIDPSATILQRRQYEVKQTMITPHTTQTHLNRSFLRFHCFWHNFLTTVDTIISLTIYIFISIYK